MASLGRLRTRRTPSMLCPLGAGAIGAAQEAALPRNGIPWHAPSAGVDAPRGRFGFYYDAIEPYVHYVPFFVKHVDDIVDVSMRPTS